MVRTSSLKSALRSPCRRVHRVTFAKGTDDFQVRFEVRWIPCCDMDDKQRLHCSRREKTTMRKMARKVAQEVYAHDTPHHSQSQQSMGQCASVAHSISESTEAYTPIMRRAFESSCRHSIPLTQKELKSLIHWVSNAHDRRGLEKLSVHGLAEYMAKYRRQAIRTVLDSHSIAMANHGYLSQTAQDSISRTYHCLSEPAVEFASLIGRADAEAVQEGELPHEEEEHIHRSSSPTCVISLINDGSSTSLPIVSCSASSMVQARNKM